MNTHNVKVEHKGKIRNVQVCIPIKWCVHVQLGNQFQDVYVEAVDERTAIAEAKIVTHLRSRWATFKV